MEQLSALSAWLGVAWKLVLICGAVFAVATAFLKSKFVSFDICKANREDFRSELCHKFTEIRRTQQENSVQLKEIAKFMGTVEQYIKDHA